jgi:hypothetical protein
VIGARWRIGVASGSDSVPRRTNVLGIMLILSGCLTQFLLLEQMVWAGADPPRTRSYYYGTSTNAGCRANGFLVAVSGSRGSHRANVYWPPQSPDVELSENDLGRIAFNTVVGHNEVVMRFVGQLTPTRMFGTMTIESGLMITCNVRLRSLKIYRDNNAHLSGVFSNVGLNRESGDWVGFELAILNTSQGTIVLYSDVADGEEAIAATDVTLTRQGVTFSVDESFGIHERYEATNAQGQVILKRIEPGPTFALDTVQEELRRVASGDHIFDKR